jgi:hypothetical protein
VNQFFYRLKAAWLYLKKYPVTVLPDNYWTDADAKAWSNFLGSDTGAKLRHLRWNRVYEAQQRAITDRKDPAYAAGIAFGILGMTSEEDSLLQISLPTDDQSESTGWDQGRYPSVNR